MESPFLEVPIPETKIYNQWRDNEDEIMLKSPLTDPEKLYEKSSDTFEKFMQEDEPAHYEIIENQLAPSVSTTKIGDITLTVADSTKASAAGIR